MDDYDGIYNFSGLKYGTYEIFDIFLLINFDGDQNIRKKRIAIRTRFFLFWVVHFKGFSPMYLQQKKSNSMYQSKF